jgi:hypothetical protein
MSFVVDGLVLRSDELLDRNEIVPVTGYKRPIRNLPFKLLGPAPRNDAAAVGTATIRGQRVVLDEVSIAAD